MFRDDGDFFISTGGEITIMTNKTFKIKAKAKMVIA
jgi:hypothetical protein